MKLQIKYWADETARDLGESDILFCEDINSIDQGVQKAKDAFHRHDFAAVELEVEDTEQMIYHISNDPKGVKPFEEGPLEL